MALKIQKKKCRNIDICDKCDNLMARESFIPGIKCRFDDWYEYNDSYCPKTDKDKYTRYELDEKCPYMLEHLLLKEETVEDERTTA